MKRETIVRAWKDPEFRASLTSEERAALPECPAGPAFTELNEGELEDAVGGGGAYVDPGEDGCICSNWPGPWTVPTFTRTVAVNPQDVAVNFDRGALNVQRF